MLVLSRKTDESIRIGRDVEIMVVEIRGDKVRLGVNAPSHVPVHRSEVADAIERDGRLNLPAMAEWKLINDDSRNPTYQLAGCPHAEANYFEGPDKSTLEIHVHKLSGAVPRGAMASVVAARLQRLAEALREAS